MVYTGTVTDDRPGWDERIRSDRFRIVAATLALIPVVIGIVWGPFFDDSVYGAFHLAQNLIEGQGLTHNAGLGPSSALRSPLFVGALALFEPVLAPPWHGLALSVLGWSVCAIAVYLVALTLGGPVAATACLCLIAFNPATVSTLGGPQSWALALAWMVVALSLMSPVGHQAHRRRRRVARAILLMLVLGASFELSTVALAVLFLGIQWIEDKSPPGWEMGMIAAATVGWGLFLAPQVEPSFAWLSSPRGLGIQQYFHESELYWLMLAPLGVGLVALMSAPKPLWAGFCWALIAALTGSEIADAAVSLMILFLAGLGVERIARWLVSRGHVRSTPGPTFALVSLLLVAPFSSLWQRFQARPVARYELQEQAAAWLRTHSDPTDTLFSPRRIGFLADRATIPADIHRRTQSEMAELLAYLMTLEPDYFVSDRTLHWTAVTGTGWFRERYSQQEQFGSAYDPGSPLTIWEYTPTVLDMAEVRSIDAAVPGKLKLIAYRYEPKWVDAGDTVHLSLYLQATGPITLGFNTAIHTVYAGTEHVWAWKDQPTPRSIPGDWWQPGQVVEERFTLLMNHGFPPGAYELQVFWHWANDETHWPVFQGDDVNELDRIRLGYVTVLPLPANTADAKSVNALFGDQIALEGMNLVGEPTPGQGFEVVLYWKALRPPAHDYTVFVHVLDSQGHQVAGHDGQPVSGTWPTRAWRPGTVVEDRHPVSLAPQLPLGQVSIEIGLYLLQTGERLPVWDAQGVSQPDGALPLLSWEVPDK